MRHNITIFLLSLLLLASIILNLFFIPKFYITKKTIATYKEYTNSLKSKIKHLENKTSKVGNKINSYIKDKTNNKN